MYRIEDNVYVKETGVYGKSLFANKDFKKDELVFVAFGSVVKQPNLYTIPIDTNLFIEPREPEGNLSQYICHSCEPNLGVKSRTFFVAMQDIKKDEEVTIDYAMIVPSFVYKSKGEIAWEGRKCLCGSGKCRGVVKGYFEMSASEQAEYEGYISDYILEMKEKGNYSGTSLAQGPTLSKEP